MQPATALRPCNAPEATTPPPSAAAPLGPVAVRVHALDAVPAELCAEWDALAAAAAEPNAFAERWFVMASVRHFPADGARLIEVREGGKLTGLLAVAVAERYGRLPVRHVELFEHPNSFLGTPLIRAGHERPVWRALLAALDAAEWAPGFLHLAGLVEGGPVLDGLRATGRRCDLVHRTERALLHGTLSPQAYYEAHVRTKRRKEVRRLQARLAEEGRVEIDRLAEAGALWPWMDAFLALEASGWKGEAGSALASSADTEGFFRAALAGAWEAGRLEMLRMTLDGRVIAMLVNFVTPPGAFAFKIAFDEAYSRFSPGVLLQLENYGVLARPDLAWMDSCAARDHPVINGLWAERRTVVRVSLPLRGAWREAQFLAVRAAERASAALRRSRARTEDRSPWAEG